eukprot:1193087-Prorocentrum_minimum.AAC.2
MLLRFAGPPVPITARVLSTARKSPDDSTGNTCARSIRVQKWGSEGGQEGVGRVDRVEPPSCHHECVPSASKCSLQGSLRCVQSPFGGYSL